jgi:hypothetical protein
MGWSRGKMRKRAVFEHSIITPGFIIHPHHYRKTIKTLIIPPPK